MNMWGIGSTLNVFLSGFLTAICVVVSLFFLRFYVKTKDRLFVCFASAFLMLGVERVFITVKEISNEKVSEVIVIRIVAFFLILWAIIDKNGRSR